MPSTRDALVAQLVTEARAMATYALGSGIVVPGWALEAIAQAEGRGAPPPRGAEDTAAHPAAPAQDKPLRALSRAHGELARLIAPMRPDLVVLLEVESNVGRARRLFGRVGIIRSFMGVTLLSLAAFIGLTISPYTNDAQYGDIFSASGLPLLINELFFLSSAAVGASFSGLFQIDREITNGTFHPHTESKYWVRFVLGLVAGLLMATVLHINSLAPPDEAGVTRFHFTGAALALVGGFSSSVVQRIIQRIIEAMETVLRGSAEQEMALREQASKVRLDEALSKERLRFTTMLTEVERRMAAGESPASIRALVDGMSREFIAREDRGPPEESGGSPRPAPAGDAGAPEDSARPFEVRAIVEAADGAPLAGAHYEIQKGGEVVASGRTDERGELAHEVGDSGDYEVLVLRRDADSVPPPSGDPAGGEGAEGGDVAAQRQRAAWHSARREIARGVARHGKRASWETDGPNRGPIVDDYLGAFMTPPSAAPWCGMFVGYNYIKAGFNEAGRLPANQTPDGRPMPRNTVFMSAYRMMLYLLRTGCARVELPTKRGGSQLATRAACAAWLDQHLRPFAPRPGDIVLFHTSRDYSHVGMVASYDPEAYELVTYEGNYDDRAGAFRWDLADPGPQGFFRVNMVGRLNPEDFEASYEVPPEGPSPEPIIERVAVASSV